MTYVIAEPCVGVLDTLCTEVCPVDCIHPGPDEGRFQRATMLYIHPVECIDCSACTEVCPVDAPMLEADLPPQWEPYIEINRAYFDEGLAAAERMLAHHLAGGAPETS